MPTPSPSRPSLRERLGGRRPRLTLVGTLVLLFALLAGALLYLAPRSPGEEITLDQLSGLLREGRVVTATLYDEDARVEGTFVEDGTPADIDEDNPPGLLAGAGGSAPEGSGDFWVSYPKSGAATAPLLSALQAGGAQVDVQTQTTKAIVRLLATVLLPLMVLANLFALLFLGNKGGGAVSELTEFGSMNKGRGRGRKKKGPQGPAPVTFADVAGADEAVVELQEVVDYLTNPQRYAALDAAPPKGVLLFGPPGTGKTLLARATAGEAGVPFFSVAGAEFVESLVGIGAARVRDLFARVRAAAPAIVFIDELDAAGRRRGTGDAGGGSDEREQTLNQLLVEMDGFDVSSGIVVMAATNRPDILDPALLRPGRFDRHITIDQPDSAGRLRILELHARNKPLADDVDLSEIARRSPGFTGADLANVVNEAALLTVRSGLPSVPNELMREAVERVRGGPQRRGRVLTDVERERIAYHEAAHAIVVAASGNRTDVDRVSILARGGGLGGTRLATDSDAVLLTASQLRAQLMQAMAGTAGELLHFGEGSTGSERDLEQATALARDIVARYGLSESIGTVRLLRHDSEVFLGGSVPYAEMSEATREQVDESVRQLMDEARERATDVLVRNRSILDDLAAELLELEHLEGAALDAHLSQVAAVRQRSRLQRTKPVTSPA